MGSKQGPKHESPCVHLDVTLLRVIFCTSELSSKMSCGTLEAIAQYQPIADTTIAQSAIQVC